MNLGKKRNFIHKKTMNVEKILLNGPINQSKISLHAKASSATRSRQSDFFSPGKHGGGGVALPPNSDRRFGVRVGFGRRPERLVRGLPRTDRSVVGGSLVSMAGRTSCGGGWVPFGNLTLAVRRLPVRRDFVPSGLRRRRPGERPQGRSGSPVVGFTPFGSARRCDSGFPPRRGWVAPVRRSCSENGSAPRSGPDLCGSSSGGVPKQGDAFNCAEPLPVPGGVGTCRLARHIAWEFLGTRRAPDASTYINSRFGRQQNLVAPTISGRICHRAVIFGGSRGSARLLATRDPQNDHDHPDRHDDDRAQDDIGPGLASPIDDPSARSRLRFRGRRESVPRACSRPCSAGSRR